MPKKMSRNKRGSTRVSTRTASRPLQIHSVKELLRGKLPLLTRVTHQATRQNLWHDFLAARVPAPLAARISGVSEHAGTLVIFAESAAWCARLRYAVLELEADIRAADATLSGIEVRVLPRG
jgi:hypothetical protein